MIEQLQHIADISRFLLPEPELYVVYDRNVEWVARELVAVLPHAKALGLETSEARKTLDTVQETGRWLLASGASRNAFLLAVGGGITTDISGFAASIYKRGIRYANLPTTLLAQVDAAIGGKTGVNLDGYKNMLGTFRMPQYTFLCADVLRTLPPREFRSGLAELLKTFLLADGAAYTAAVAALAGEPCTKNADFVHRTPEMAEPCTKMGDFVHRAAEIKAGIVARDPEEHGERAKLNLGHTFGHALEHEARLRGDDLTHGEAVAIGILLAARLGESLGLAENGLAALLEADFKRLGLPAECPYSLGSLQDAMAKDKKALGGGSVKFVLPVRPGEVVFHEMNPYDLHFDTK